jgi:hypothetical protein
MKDQNNAGVRIIALGKRCLQIIAILMLGQTLNAQEEMAQERDATPVKRTFESIMLMDQQTVMIPVKGTFEMDFQHRFGTWDNGYDNLFGIFSPSNIRIGFDYVPVERLMVGFGFTKENLVWDMFGKYALLRQGKSGGSPISLTYYGNAAIDTRGDDDTGFEESTDRWSFFHSAMVARKFSDDFSIQLSGNLSWFNFKSPVFDDEGVHQGRDRNAHFSASALARYKFSNVMSFTVGYDQPITEHRFFDPEPNLSIGLEVVTSSHAFQVFVGNFHRLVPQYNHSYNSNKFFGTGNFDGNQILIGFNITRLWNF